MNLWRFAPGQPVELSLGSPAQVLPAPVAVERYMCYLYTFQIFPARDGSIAVTCGQGVTHWEGDDWNVTGESRARMWLISPHGGVESFQLPPPRPSPGAPRGW